MEPVQATQPHPQLSFHRFARYVGVSFRRLRDQQHRTQLYEKVRQAALQHPTCENRLLYQKLKAQGERMGLRKIRVALGELNLHPPLSRKTRKPSVKVSVPQDWPEGRRVQIDAPLAARRRVLDVVRAGRHLAGGVGQPGRAEPVDAPRQADAR